MSGFHMEHDVRMIGHACANIILCGELTVLAGTNKYSLTFLHNRLKMWGR